MTDQKIADPAQLAETMLDMGRRARAASRKLGQMRPADRSRGLKAVAAAIKADAAKILAANEQDMAAAREKG
ncbi:MAG: gamma-glutamyl-phosphate reductase, partial [Hyphomonas sp.]|nr:gamma-glutamyl-phosphate reductase [Hyphomonas sp.]